MNDRGGVSIAALALAAIAGTAAAQMAVSVRAAERRSNDALEETAARAQVLVRSLEERSRFTNDEAVRVNEFTERAGDSTLTVKVTWQRAGGEWHVSSWMEVRAWPGE